MNYSNVTPLNEEATINNMIILANEQGVNPAKEAFQDGSDLVSNVRLWRDPASTGASREVYSDITLLNEHNPDFFARFVWSVSKAVKFPASTAYLHGLAVLSTAMIRNFKMDYNDNLKPVNLYVITSQPAGVGKTGVSEFLSDPITDAYDQLNEANEIERDMLIKSITANEKEKDKQTGKNEIKSLYKQVKDQKDKLDKVLHFEHFFDDVTAEGLQAAASNQGCFFNVISSESSTVTTLLGNTYSASPNLAIFMKPWDYEPIKTYRVGRKAELKRYSGTFAVMAHDKAILDLLQSGLNGEGVNERVLLMREKSMRGSRNFRTVHKVEPELIHEYNMLVENIVNSEDVTLTFQQKSIDELNAYRETIEPHLDPEHCKYGHDMIAGFIGKCDKQTIRLASIIHVANNWGTGGKRETVVSHKAFMQALEIFKAIFDTYVQACDSLGYSGKATEEEILINKIHNWVERKKVKMQISTLVNNIKKDKAFQRPGLTKHLKEKVLPRLESMAYLVFTDREVYFNPKLNG